MNGRKACAVLHCPITYNQLFTVTEMALAVIALEPGENKSLQNW